MGMNISASLIFGAYYDELHGVDGLDDLIDNCDLQCASPWYDSDRENWIVGIELPSEIAGEAEMLIAIRNGKAEFERLTGSVGRIIATPDVT